MAYIKIILINLLLVPAIVFSQKTGEGTPADTASTLESSVQRGKELPHKRTTYSKTYLNSDNTGTLEISLAPVHYKDTGGKFREIKTNWVNADSGKYKVRKGFYTASFSSLDSEFPIVLQLQDGATFKSKLSGMGYYDKSSKQYVELEQAQTSNHSIAGNALEFKNIFTGVDARVEYQVSQLKESFYLTQKGREALPVPETLGLKDNSSYLVFAAKIEPDLNLEAYSDSVKIASKGKGISRDKKFDHESEKRIDFKSENGKLKYYFPLDYAWIEQTLTDSSNTQKSKLIKEKVLKRIISTEEGDFVFAGIPYKWIQKQAPGTIIIDPTIGIQPQLGNGKDDWMYKSNGGDDNFGASVSIEIGPDRTTYERRGVIEFNLSAIPENAVISQATLQLYLYSNWGSATDFTIEAHKMLMTWAEGTGVSWNNNVQNGIDWTWASEPYTQWLSAGMGAGQDYETAVVSETLIKLTDDEVWKSWDLTTAVQDWIGGTNKGLALVTKSSDMSKHIGARFRSSDYTTDPSLSPKLIVELQVNPLVSYDYEYNTGAADFKVTTQYANGWTEVNELSSRGLLLKRDYTENSSPRFKIDNTYDASGYLEQQVSQQLFVSNTLAYESDDLNRLKDFKVGGVSQRTYTYDDNGNITNLGGTSLTYADFGTNRVTSSNDGSVTNYSYDASGRITQIGTKIIAYDHRNLMTHYNYNATLGTFDLWNKYDAAGRRVRKVTDYDSKFYIHSGDQVLAEYETDKYPDDEYIYAGGQRIAKLKGKSEEARITVSMKAISKGWADGNNAELYVGGTNYAIGGSGYILVVIDQSSDVVLDQKQFNTLVDEANADAMAAYINGLDHGRIVLVGVRDEASSKMNENAYQALESLGSTLCRNVGYRDSHAFIGRKGAIPGTVEEKHTASGLGVARVEVHVVDCNVVSAGFHDGNHLTMYTNGNLVNGSWGRGHNISVIDESTGSILATNNYDTYGSSAAAAAMATYINGLPTGRIVMVGVKDASSINMTEAGYLALESLGSANCRSVWNRESFAMIGVKGAAIGSVPEEHRLIQAGYAEVELSAPAVNLKDGFHFYATDHLNSTRRLDDWDSSVSDLEVNYYYPYGETHTQSGGGEGTDYKFTGYEEDSGIGLYYARARYYNPAIGRFLTPDPAGQFWSPYSYASGMPHILVDPDGEAFFVPLLIAGAVGVAIDISAEYAMSEITGEPFKYSFWDGVKSFTQSAATAGFSYATKLGKLGNFAYKLANNSGWGWTLLRGTTYATIDKGIDIGFDVAQKKKINWQHEVLDLGLQSISSTLTEKAISGFKWDDPYNELNNYEKRKIEQLVRGGALDRGTLNTYDDFSFRFVIDSELRDFDLHRGKINAVHHLIRNVERASFNRAIIHKVRSSGINYILKQAQIENDVSKLPNTYRNYLYEQNLRINY